ncbi:MAG: metalloregulator ArsR/SmtB family transcription factor [Rhizobiaceae bacterium]
MYTGDPFAAISDPNRRILLEALRRGPATVNAVALALPDISRPAVSQHLRALLEAGLVTVRAEGTKRIYSIQPTGFDGLNLWLDQFWTS